MKLLYSMVGYKNGDVEIPDVLTMKTVYPIENSKDDSQRIQQAIDEVSALPLDINGIRGAVLLATGTFILEKSIYIKSDGVVCVAMAWKKIKQQF